MVAVPEANSVIFVTLREQVSAGLDSGGVDALADTADIDPELLGTVLSHFADTASLSDADALAPMVTAASHVPFDPELDGVGSEVVAASPLDAEVDPDDFDRADAQHREVVDEDPGDFDDIEHSDAALESAGDEPDGEPEDAFGTGGVADESVAESWADADDPMSFADSPNPEIDPFSAGDEVDAAIDPAREFDPGDFDHADSEALPEANNVDDIDFID